MSDHVALEAIRLHVLEMQSSPGVSDEVKEMAQLLSVMADMLVHQSYEQVERLATMVLYLKHLADARVAVWELLENTMRELSGMHERMVEHQDALVATIARFEQRTEGR